MPNTPPEGWIKVKLGEVCLPVVTIQPEASPSAEFTYFDIGAIDNETNRITQIRKIAGRNAPSRARQAVRKNDILFSTVRTYLRNIARIEHEYPNPVASTGLAVIRAAKGVSADFLFFQVLSEDFLQPLHALQSGSSYPAIRESDLFDQPILLPPSEEQERIAAKLRALLSRVAAGEAAAHRAQERLKRYRAAVLHAALTGELTRSWRESHRDDEQTGQRLQQRLLATRREHWEEVELQRIRRSGRERSDEKWKSRYPEPKEPELDQLPKVPEKWVWASADQITEATRPITYGVVKLGAETDGGVPVLRSSDVRFLRIELDTVKRIAKSISDEYLRTVLKGGEVLVTVRGTLGGVAAVPAGCAGYNISREVAMLALLEPAMAPLVASFIAAQVLQQWLLRRSKGIAYTGINIETLRALPIPLPPISEQVELVQAVERRWAAADQLTTRLEQQLARARTMRQSLLREALAGTFVPQDSTDEPASVLLERIRIEKAELEAERKRQPRRTNKRKIAAMQETAPTPEILRAAWERLGRQGDARRLFDEAGCSHEHVAQFYQALNATAELRSAFRAAADGRSRQRKAPEDSRAEQAERPAKRGRFRLIELWLENFKNLKDYTVRFEPAFGLDIILGWNGVGKSNLFEVLLVIFRDLYEWWEKNHWPAKPMSGYRLRYEIDEELVEVNWQPAHMKRPELSRPPKGPENQQTAPVPIKRDQLQLPSFVFGYYSGPTNRLAEHFLPMKQAHYTRLRQAESDDAATLANLLRQRRFFCAETHHAKYVLLAFSYKEDSKITEFLESRLRILGFESALFIIRKPPWAKPGSKPEDFWGATGIMRRVAERLRRYAVAPMVLRQKVSYGYRSTTEDHYYFFLPDLDSLHSFAAEYQDARTFFLALESTDFSELISDVQIQVRIKATSSEQVPITFRQLSEGEQQLLMVMGLMRFTKSHQSLVLLDEPDTHLNPHWSIEYLKDLTRVMSDDAAESPEQQTSQILIATHDPLVIASLVKEQISLLKRDSQSLRCYWERPSQDARGLGFTGILTSEMFGFRSDLDEETLALLDKHARLAGKETLDREETADLEALTGEIEKLGFKSASSDPYYRAFIQAVMRRQEARDLLLKPILTKTDIDALRRETSKILQEIETEESKEQ